MDVSKILQLAKKNGDTFIVIENGEPEMVLMSFREYEDMVNRAAAGEASLPKEKKETPEPPKGTVFETFDAAVVADVPAPSRPHTSAAPRLENIRLEDLPI